MRPGIRGKLFLVSLGLIVVCVAVAFLFLENAFDRFLTQREAEHLQIRAAGAARAATHAGLPDGDRAGWDALADGLAGTAEARVTIVGRDGSVWGDSELPPEQLARVENHGTRVEVRDALERGHGSATRHSTTLGHRMMYVAAPFPADAAPPVGVVRLAVPLTAVDDALARMRWLLALGALLALVVAVALSGLAAHWAGRNVRSATAVARKLAAGDLSVRTRSTEQDEVGELARALDGLAESLSTTLGTLRSERDLLQGVLQGMTEGVLLIDAHGRIVLLNAALRQSLLLDADLAGKLLLEALRHAELRELLEAARRSPTPTAGEIEVEGLKPRRFLVHASRVPGEAGGLLAVFVDVTDLRRLETIRKDFVANVSHELRTPVAAVRSAAETLRGALERDPAAAGRFTDIIERNAERLQRLVEDLLDLSRIESREYRPSLEPLDIVPVVQHVLGLHRERAEAKRLRLEAELPAALPAARADRRALEQVLSNLVDNAVKYCPAGAAVAVRAAVEGDRLRLAVEDTGPGIEAQHLPRLFERFYRVDTGRSRELGGTGLGLSIVKHLVEAMGGTVGVDSTPGKGTTFRFTLPLARPIPS
ncbi:MAG: HAMP domain-containing protein [Deltaproteobacteria bacterium]|nr:HAMP domain-containing protein [Deltaproteobacteria bacterium]